MPGIRFFVGTPSVLNTSCAHTVQVRVGSFAAYSTLGPFVNVTFKVIRLFHVDVVF